MLKGMNTLIEVFVKLVDKFVLHPTKTPHLQPTVLESLLQSQFIFTSLTSSLICNRLPYIQEQFETKLTLCNSSQRDRPLIIFDRMPLFQVFE